MHGASAVAVDEAGVDHADAHEAEVDLVGPMRRGTPKRAPLRRARGPVSYTHLTLPTKVSG